jgi:hypothetical protein
MKYVYLIFIVIIVLTLITILISLINRYVIYPLLNKPMIHENCTKFYICKTNFFEKINCSCIYYEKNCEKNCEHSKECQEFIYGCSLKGE